MTPDGKALIIAGDRALISGSERGDLWRMVRRQVAPARGIRAKVRKAALGWKDRTPATRDVILNTASTMDGIMQRDSHSLHLLRDVDVKYSAEWTVVVLNSFLVDRLSLSPALSASDWAHVLPRLTLPSLEEFAMGRTMVYGNPELRDISTVDLDAFLARHGKIARLEYVPQLPSESSEFSLASLPDLTHLTTTPAHFIHLHHAPNTFLELTDLILFSPALTPLSSAREDFAEVLNLLAGSSPGDAQTLHLRFPGAWITSPPAGLAISCVESMLLYGDFALDGPVMAEFVAPFASGLKRIELHPTEGSAFERLRLVDKLRHTVAGVDVSCCRTDYVRTVTVGSRSRTRKTKTAASVAYSD
ncbi:hypothetical protein C8R44DRAFT_224020 [Mycena epipterygia]|nr:hypothetical protein C8R44DRAFT_224020 [Mycena epipterygia]